MIPALLLGRKGSVGFPGKNTLPVLGRPLGSYPILHAKHSRYVDKVFISTDDPRLMDMAGGLGVDVIKRPDYLCTPSALGEDAFKHGFEEISKRCPGEKIELVVLLFCNSPTFLARHIDEGVEILRKNPQTDSAVTVSAYNWYSPVRARRVNAEGYLDPFIPFENYPQSMTINCDRNAGGDVYFADMGVSVVRPDCLEKLHEGILPQKWMGRKIHPIQNWGGLDVDVEWQMPLVEFWLKKNGFTETSTPYGD